eukprot:154675-Alexandrium_andersonii.AAC.1
MGYGGGTLIDAENALAGGIASPASTLGGHSGGDPVAHHSLDPVARGVSQPLGCGDTSGYEGTAQP